MVRGVKAEWQMLPLISKLPWVLVGNQNSPKRELQRRGISPFLMGRPGITVFYFNALEHKAVK